jgi:hypothetical protein
MTRDQVLQFLNRTPTGHPDSKAVSNSGITAANQGQPPEETGFWEGLTKGLSREALGTLSLIPGTGDLFTRKGSLGKSAYAPVTGLKGTIGLGIGTVAPWVLGGELLAGARGIRALTSLSPKLSQLLTGATAVGSEAVAPGAAILRTVGPAASVATKGRRVGTVGRAAITGGIAGAAQEPEGDTTYGGRALPALTGALSAGSLRGLGLTSKQMFQTNNLVVGLSLIPGFAMAGPAGAVMAGIIARMAMHRMDFGVNAANHIAPQIAEMAQKLAANAARPSVAGATGAVTGALSNELLQSEKPR